MFRFVSPLFLSTLIGSCLSACQGATAPEPSAQGGSEGGAAPGQEGDNLEESEAGDFRSRLAHHDTASGTFVHLFSWPWPDVGEECETVLGPAGYSAVQVSPPHEHAVIGLEPWWQRYQPVSYQLESRSGSAAQFDDMVERCARAGVAVYVDAVINHMSSQDSGVGSAGTEFTKYDYPDYGPEDFHQPPCSIDDADYQQNPDRVWGCELLALPDLKTESPTVRENIVGYLADLVQRGVRGFRIDAAKHMPPSDLRAIIERVDALVEQPPYYFPEVIAWDGEAIAASDYLDVAGSTASEVDVTEFRFQRVEQAFRAESASGLADLAQLLTAPPAWLPPDRAVVFVDNHDAQRADALFYQDGADHRLAQVYLLAQPYGYPKIMSSFAFSRESGVAWGPPTVSAIDRTTLGAHSGGECVVPVDADELDSEQLISEERGQWICEHRDPWVLAMIDFRRVVEDAPVVQVWNADSDQLAFAREGRGFVVFNRAQEELERTFETSLPAGSYCNVLASRVECPTPIEVDETGQALVAVEPASAVALHVERTQEAP